MSEMESGASSDDESGTGTSVGPATASAAAPSPAGQAPVSADLAQVVTKIDRSIKERRDSDAIFINYWLYLFVVSWVTVGIYGLILFFKRINRIDRFGRRKQAYYEALIDWTERYSQQQGKEDDVYHMLADMRSETSAAYKGDLRQIKAGVSFLLTLVTVGIYGLYVLYRMNRYWWDAQVVEQEFDDKLSQTWTTLGLMRYPVSFKLDQGKRRSYPLYLILSIVTVGIWGIVWDYNIHTDPDNLFGEFHSIEDTVLQTIRAH
jgi:Domain of unknown function (DUF4234)